MPHAITGVPAMFGILIGTPVPIKDYRASKWVDDVLARKINVALRQRGVFPNLTTKSRCSCAPPSTPPTS